MEALAAGDLLREARIRHGLSQESLAIRAGIARAVVVDIETDQVADVVRQNRRGGADGLGRSLKPEPLLGALARHGVDFVVIGSVAGLAHGSAYPTYDLDVAFAGGVENLKRLAAGLTELGVQVHSQVLGERDAISFDTEFGTLDLLRQIPGVESYEQLRRESSRELLAGAAVQVASLDHLIAMKRAANRVKDQLMVLEYVELFDEIRRREAEDD